MSQVVNKRLTGGFNSGKMTDEIEVGDNDRENLFEVAVDEKYEKHKHEHKDKHKVHTKHMHTHTNTG